MKLYAPSYYKDFKCIADKCRHSCCVGWEIDIDKSTLDKYRGAMDGRAAEIISSVELLDTPHFKLVGERCPHLDKKGLCRIITELGEDYIPLICREHPRFYNTSGERVEVGLGLSCEEALRIVLSSDAYDDIIPIDMDPCQEKCEKASEPAIRRRVFSILKDREMPYSDRLFAIYKELREPLKRATDEEWRDAFSNLEYLNEENRDLFSSFKSDISENESNTDILERFLAYLVYRHCHSGLLPHEEIASLGFALLLERLIASVACAKGLLREEIIDLARVISLEIEYSEDNTEELKLNFY